MLFQSSQYSIIVFFSSLMILCCAFAVVYYSAFRLKLSNNFLYCRLGRNGPIREINGKHIRYNILAIPRIVPFYHSNFFFYCVIHNNYLIKLLLVKNLNFQITFDNDKSQVDKSDQCWCPQNHLLNSNEKPTAKLFK